MSWRERIILILMAAVVLYGLVDYISGKFNQGGASERLAQAAASAEADATRIRALVQDVVFTPGEEESLSRIVKPWGKSILVDVLTAPEPVVEEPEEAESGGSSEPLPSFRYTGYMKVGGVKMAVINGAEYAQGDALKASTYLVGDIQPDHVILRQSSTDKTVQLPRQGEAHL